jgi:protein ImuB
MWLAVFLPELALEVCTRGLEIDGPFAVVQGQGAGRRLVACNRAAGTAGLLPGCGLAAAWALLPGLRVMPREPDRERAALEHLAAWAGRFTPAVSLEAGRGLLLEVGASLTLWGGLASLWDRVRADLIDLGYSARLAAAPTPLGAWLLACADCQERVPDLAGLRERLGALPLAALELADGTLQALQGLGIRIVQGLLALPRAGLARRLGPQVLARLDRALGLAPDPRASWIPPAAFHARLPLPAEVSDAAALLFPLRRLLLDLQAYLEGVDGGVQRIEIALVHPRATTTGLTLGLLGPSRDAPHLLGLARTRLDRLTLPAPVQELRVEAAEVLPLPARRRDLFEKATGQEWQGVVERLSVRLGAEAVRGLTVLPEHRPEQAWRTAATAQPAAGPGGEWRPLWLLAEPRPLDLVQNRPALGGVLRLCQGPERIETGWWDGADVARDYFVAQDPAGAWLWVFQDRRDPGRWFLHGIFA